MAKKKTRTDRPKIPAPAQAARAREKSRPSLDLSVLRDTAFWGGWALAFVFGLWIGRRPIWDTDAHWHLALGRADLAGGMDPVADPLSWMPIVRSPDIGFRFIDRAMAFVAARAGIGFLTVLFAMSVGAIFAEIYRRVAARTRSLALGLVATAFVAAFVVDRLQLRPDWLAICLFFLFVLNVDEAPTPKAWVTSFVIALVWAYVHPSIILALAVAILGALADRPAARLVHVLAAAAAIVLRPGGPLELAQLYRDTAAIAPLVPEFKPLWALGARDFMSMADYIGAWVRWGLALFITFIAWPRKSAPRGVAGASFGAMARALLALAAAIASFRFFFLLGTVALWAIASLSPALRTSRTLRVGALIVAIGLTIVFPLRQTATIAQRLSAAGLSPFAEVYTPNFPVGAAAYLKAHPLEGRLFHPPEWGGYLAWELGPARRTAVDARLNVFGPDLGAEVLRFKEPTVRRSMVERFGIEILVVPPGVIPDSEIVGIGTSGADHRWVRVFADAQSQVLIDARGAHEAKNRDILRAMR